MALCSSGQVKDASVKESLKCNEVSLLCLLQEQVFQDCWVGPAMREADVEATLPENSCDKGWVTVFGRCPYLDCEQTRRPKAGAQLHFLSLFFLWDKGVFLSAQNTKPQKTDGTAPSKGSRKCILLQEHDAGLDSDLGFELGRATAKKEHKEWLERHPSPHIGASRVKLRNHGVVARVDAAQGLAQAVLWGFEKLEQTAMELQLLECMVHWRITISSGCFCSRLCWRATEILTRAFWQTVSPSDYDMMRK